MKKGGKYSDDNIQNIYEETLKENRILKQKVELLLKLIEECGLGTKYEEHEEHEDEEKKVILS